MSGILEIIFQGFLEWAYTLILEIWEFFSTAILNIMRMDFSYLESHIPILPVLQQSFLAVGWALLIGNLVFQSVRSMLTGLGFDAEDPKLLFSRTFVFSFLLVASPQICDIALNMTAVVIRMLEMPNAVVITTLSEGAFAGLGTAWLLVIICGLVVMYQSVKLFIEMAERYFILSMLTITSPMAFGLGGSRSTSDIFTNWCRMYGSMCLMMAMNVVFIKILLSVLAYSPTGPDVLPWMVLVMAVVRTAKKFDSIISRLGLNPAITNEPRMPGMLSIMVARTMMSGAAKVISQNGASGAGRSGGANPPPGGGYGQGNGGGQGSGGGGRNDSRNRNFNNNRDNGKGGRRDRNGNSPAPEGAPSSGGRKRDSGSANPDNPDAPRNRDASRKPDAAPSGSNTGNGGQKQTERSGKGYRRNGSESGGAQRNRSYRKRNNPPDSPPGAGGQDASQRSRQDTARDSSSSQFREQRQSSETSFTRNGETVAGNGGGGQFQREQGFAEGGRFDTRRTSAPPGGQHAPRYSGRRQPPPDSENVSGTASGGAANNAASNAGASEKGRSANPKSTRYTNRPKNEASQRTTPDGAPTPLSASRTRTDEQSRRDATENRTSATDRPDVSSSGSSRTSVTDSRFTQRGEIASQGKAKDGTPPPPNDAPPASTPDAAPRNVTAPITLEKPSPAKEGGSDSGETRFSNRPASSATTTTAAAHVTSTAKSGAPSRDVPPPSEKTASNSTDTRFTNRTVSANATGADSTQTHAVESRTAPATTPDAAPRNVTAPVAPAKETDSASKEMRFTSHPAPASQTPAGTGGGTFNGVVSQKETDSNAKETRLTNRSASLAASAHTTASGVTSNSAAASKETDSASKETRFTNRSASTNAVPASQTPAATDGGMASKKETDSNSGETRFTSRSASATANSAASQSSSFQKETDSTPRETRFSNRPASASPKPAVMGDASAKSGVTSQNVSSSEKKQDSEETRFTSRSAQQNAVSSSATPAATGGGTSNSKKDTDSSPVETRFTNRPASTAAVPAPQTPAATNGGTSQNVSFGKETVSNSGETRFTNRSASQNASSAASTHTIKSGVTSNSAASKETDSASKEMRFTNRSASQTPTPASGVASNNADSGETDSSAERTRFTNRSSPATVIPAPPMSMPTGGGTSPDKNANADSGETRFTSRPALSTVVPASVTPTDGTSNGAVAGKETDANSAETRFSNRSASANVIPASPMPTTTGGGTSPDKNTNSDSGETRFTNRSVSSNVGSAPPANGATSSGETDSKPNGTRFTGRPAAPDSSSLASAGGVTPRVNSGTTPDRPPHDRDRVNRTEKRPASVSPSGNGGNADEKPGGAQIGASSTAPPSHVVSSGKADGISVTESCFSQRNSAKAAGQSRPAAPIPTPAPKADSPHGNATGGASAYETRQSSRETRDGGTSERAPVTVPSASAKPERGEASGASDAATANPSRPGRSSSNNVPRPPMSGGGAEQNATRQSARDNAGQKSERTENGASAPHPAAVAPHVNSGDNNRPTRPGRTAMENHSEPAPVQRTFASGANASAETLHSGESRVSAKQPNGTDHASANPQRPASFNHNAVPPRPVTPGEASHTIETRREKDVTPRSATPPNASERQNNPPRQGQSPRTVHVSANAAPTRPDAGRTERRADGRPQPDGRSAPRSRTSSDTAAGQRTSQTTYSFNNGVPPRSNTGTANRANVESPARRDNASTPRPSISPDTAAGRQSRQPGQQSGRPNQAREGQRTPQPTHSHDNYGSAPRPDRGAAERNDARRPAAQPQAAPRPLARDMANGRYIEQRGQQRTPDTRNADSYRRAPVPNDAAGNPNAAPRQNSERRPNPVPARGGYYDAEWRPAPARRENGAPQPPRRDGKEPLRGGVTERGRTEKPSDSGREKRPLFDFFGFGGGKRK